MKNLNAIISILIIISFISWSCKDDDDPDKIIEISPGPNAEQEIQEAFITVENFGWTILLKAGEYPITGTLSMDGKFNTKIRGEGPDKTILSFENQSDGGDGLLITNSGNITISDLRIEDTVGDALKVRNTAGVIVDNVSTVWNGDVSPENGGYGIYPVLCSNVIVRNSMASGASDAGIYVGQSLGALVHNNTVHENVAGIEIENTIDADVYNNHAQNNTAGILVFDLPGLTQSGENIRVFDNTVIDNNHDNFAPPGGIVREVPPGTGILVLATKNVEVFNNTVTNNEIVGVAAFSFISIATVIGQEIPEDFNPFFDQVYIFDNQISRENSPNPNQTAIGLLLVNQFGAVPMPMPDLLTDGIFSPEAGENGGLCIKNNGTEYFVNLHMGSQSSDPSVDLGPHDCTFLPLPGVTIPG